MAAGSLVGVLRRPGWWLGGMLVQFSGAAGSAVLAGVFWAGCSVSVRCRHARGGGGGGCHFLFFRDFLLVLAKF